MYVRGPRLPMTNLGTIASLIGLGALLWGVAATWQGHLDRSQRQCERMAEHVAVLERLLSAEHPEYISWVTWEDQCR